MKPIEIATKFIEMIRDRCDRVEIAGSVRRGRSRPKDIEIVALPRQSLLFWIDQLVRRQKLRKALYTDGRHRWGEKYRGIEFHGMTVELYLARPDNWGYIFWMRTGPGAANQFVMAQKMRSPFTVKDGTWYWGDKKLAIPDEHTLFKLLGLPYIRPDNRSQANYARHFNNTRHRWGDPRDLVIDEPPQPVQETLL